MKRGALPFVAILVLIAGSVSAQDADYSEAHGRVRYVEPGVTLQRASDAGAEEAGPNSPLLPGDRIWTDGGGRAEFEFAGGNVLRLDSRGKLDYASEPGRDEAVVLRLWSGSLVLHTRDRRGPRFEVETPGGLVTVDDRAVVRVDAESSETRVAVYDGQAGLEAARRRLTVNEGEYVLVRRGEWPEPPRRFDRSRRDDFGEWDRARAEYDDGRGSRSARYLPEEMAPYGRELDSNGSWQYEAEVGYVWRPTVAVGWQPYTNGRWAWTTYGWTWIPNESWGWAPSHYGRWGYSAGLGWYWVPGHVWGPAWVSWAVGADYVGWCPLGYRDRAVAVGVGSAYATGHAVPRGSFVTGVPGSSAWTFARRSDIAARDIAKRRVAVTPAEVSQLRVAESPRMRPSRDLRSMEAPNRAVVRTRPSPGDTVPELRTDPYTTIPFPVRRERGGERGRYDQADDRANVVGASRSAEPAPVPVASPRASEDERARSAPGTREEPQPRNEGRAGSADPDRDVLRKLFQPLAEPHQSRERAGERSGDDGGARPRGSDAQPQGSEPRGPTPRATTTPPPRPATPKATPAPPPHSAEQRKPPKDH
jgi:hypothetical protein